MTLRILTTDDLPAVATIHLAAFPRAAVSRLGLGAARRFYDSLLSGPHETVGWGLFEENRLAGFSFVGVRHIAEKEFVRHHSGFLAWRLVTHPWLLAESFIWSRIGSACRLLLPRIRAPVASPSVALMNNAARSYGIQYLAVDPGWQGRGVGRPLLIASEEHARQQGCAEIHLSVYLDNARAIGFYEHMGWQKLPPGAAWQGFMFKRLEPAVGAGVRSSSTASGGLGA